MSTKPKTATQRDAAAFLRAIRRLLKASAQPPEFDPGYMHASTLRTLSRCVRGLQAAKTDTELAAEMNVARELLDQLLELGCEADGVGHMGEVVDLMDL